MKMVLLFFCVILIFIIGIISSDVRLNVKKCNVHNINKGKKIPEISEEFLVYIEFMLFGLFRIARIRLTKEKFEKLNISKDLKSLKKDVSILKELHILEAIKNRKIKVKKFNLSLELGFENMNITIYAVTLISSLLRNIFWNIEFKES